MDIMFQFQPYNVNRAPCILHTGLLSFLSQYIDGKLPLDYITITPKMQCQCQTENVSLHRNGCNACTELAVVYAVDIYNNHF